MDLTTADEVYEKVVRPLPESERIRLAERIAREISETPAPASDRRSWMSLRGIAPDLLGDEDAQDWVTRTRLESDMLRERQWRRNP